MKELLNKEVINQVEIILKHEKSQAIIFIIKGLDELSKQNCDVEAVKEFLTVALCRLGVDRPNK